LFQDVGLLVVQGLWTVFFKDILVVQDLGYWSFRILEKEKRKLIDTGFGISLGIGRSGFSLDIE